MLKPCRCFSWLGRLSWTWRRSNDVPLCKSHQSFDDFMFFENMRIRPSIPILIRSADILLEEMEIQCPTTARTCTEPHSRLPKSPPWSFPWKMGRSQFGGMKEGPAAFSGHNVIATNLTHTVKPLFSKSGCGALKASKRIVGCRRKHRSRSSLKSSKKGINIPNPAFQPTKSYKRREQLSGFSLVLSFRSDTLLSFEKESLPFISAIHFVFTFKTCNSALVHGLPVLSLY